MNKHKGSLSHGMADLYLKKILIVTLEKSSTYLYSYLLECIRTMVRITKHMMDINGALAQEAEPSDDSVLHWLACQCLTLPALSRANRHNSKLTSVGRPFITWLRILYGTSCSNTIRCPSRATSLKSAMSPRDVTYHVTDTLPSDLLLKKKKHLWWEN